MSPNPTSPQQEAIYFLAAFILAIALMVSDHFGKYMDSVRSVILTSLSPLESMASAPVHIYNHFATDFSNYDELLLENQQLKTELLILKSKQQQLINLQREVKRLENLLGTTGKIASKSVQIASVNFYSNNPLSQFISIDKGSLDGVQQQQTVIDDKGIMGQVVLTSPNFARVLLITDPDHQIPIRIQRTAQRGILQGTGHDQAALNFIPKQSDIRVGDILESSGLGGVFPEGYPVAEVIDIQELGESPYLKIIAIPIANINQANKVLVIEYEVETLRPKIFRQPTNDETVPSSDQQTRGDVTQP